MVEQQKADIAEESTTKSAVENKETSINHLQLILNLLNTLMKCYLLKMRLLIKYNQE